MIVAARTLDGESSDNIERWRQMQRHTLQGGCVDFDENAVCHVPGAAQCPAGSADLLVDELWASAVATQNMACMCSGDVVP